MYLTPDEVKIHLIYNGFVKGYLCWLSHKELQPEQYDFGYSTIEMTKAGGSSYTNYDHNECYVDCMECIVGDAILANQNVRDEESNTCEAIL